MTAVEDTESWGQRLGVTAGITDRTTGSLGLWTDETVDAVMNRWRSLRKSFHPRFPALHMAHQVHGTAVLWHAGVAQGWHVADGADGHATSQRGLMLAVTVADCVPVYLADTKGRGVALLHAGWRGVAGGMLSAGVRCLAERAGVAASDLAAHCGVSICGNHYEVDEDVSRAVLGAAAPAGKSCLDLRAALAAEAGKLGLTDVSVSPLCTRCHNDRFFSHRAGDPGRQIAFIGIS